MTKETEKKREPWQEYQAVYVHIPFCRQKCLYCDFASYAGHTEAEMRAYTRALCHEIRARAEEAGKLAAGATVYFGGGTPSILTPDCTERIVASLGECGFWQNPREASIEANPGTVDLAKLEFLRHCGFDRISIGVQSLQDEELRACGRIHDAREALAAVAMARAAGFARESCDLIYGLPLQTLASFQDTLARIIAAGIGHLSVYGLIVEEGTPLENLARTGKIKLPDEDLCADMYELAEKMLTDAGFERYEISNYARRGQYSRHNDVYWQYHPYIAFGAGACGMMAGERRTALPSPRDYIAHALALTEENWRGAELYQVEQLSPAQQLQEFMFMGLRRSGGADVAEARARYGVDVMQAYAGQLRPFLERGYLRFDGRSLALTSSGMEIGNQIFGIF